MKNRLLSFLLVIAMLLPMFNITAMAASEPTITSHKNGKSYAPDDFYIKWKSVDGANRYRLAVKSLNDGSYAADVYWDDKLTKTKYECDEDDIKPGHRYKIWVAACGSGHDDVLSQYSIEVTAKAEEKDTTLPMINPIKSSAGTTFEEGTKTTFSTRASDNALKKLYMYIDGDKVESTSSDTISYKMDDLEVGRHTIEVVAEDESGNENETSITVTVTEKPIEKDTTLPMINPIKSSAGSSFVEGTNTTFSTRASDNELYKIYMYIDGKEVKKSSSDTIEYSTSSLSVGNHTIEVVAEDESGNENETSITVTVTPKPVEKDTTLPMINPIKSSAGSSFVEGTNTTFSTRASDNALYKIYMYIDGKEVKKSSSDTIEYSTSSLSAGNHTIEVVAEDESGNENETSITVTVTEKPVEKDTTLPMINPIKSSAGNSFAEGTNTTFSTRASDNALYKIYMYIDGKQVKTSSSDAIEYSTSSLSVGKHTIEVVAEDKSGNENDTSITVNVTTPYIERDTTVPMLNPIKSSAGNSFAEGTKTTFSTRASDNALYRMYMYIDGKQVKTSSSDSIEYSTSSLSVGKHTIEVLAEDESGNENETSITITVIGEPLQSKPSISSASVSPTSGTLNDTKFKFTVKTNKDTTDLLVRAFNGYEITSDYLNDLKCSTSGSTKTWTFWLKINNLDSKYINIYALNDNGDESGAKKVSFTVKEAVIKDTTKPQVTKLECENGETFTQTSGYVTFNVNATDNIGVSKIELYLGNTKLGTENGGSVGFAISGSKFKVGKNTISAYAYDDAGNKSSAKTITLNIKEQQTISKPSINSASVSPTKGTLNETKFKFTVKTNKDTTDLLVRAFNGYEITSDYLNDLKCSTSGSTKTWTFWLKINNINSSYVNVYALNDDGEESSAKKVSFTVSEKKDTTKPQVTKLECENGTTFSQTSGYVTFNVKATDNIGVSKIELYCGNKKLAENDSDSMGTAILCSEFVVGQNTITAYAYDKAGNKSSAKTIKITIKAVEGKGTPTINSANVSPTKGTLNETQFKFTVKTNKEATDLLVRAFNGYEITSDKLNDLKCTTSGNTKTWTFWLKINNINSSYVNVYALNDNDDESGAKKVSFTVSEPPKKDETAPVIGDITSSAGSTFKKGTSTKITVAVTDENLSEAVLYVDNKKIKNFTSGKILSTLSSLTIGTHNVTIKAKDKAGNAAEKSITLTVTDPKAVIPTVEVLSATNITATSTTLQGKVTSNSGVKIKKYGFAYDDGTNTQYKWIDGHIDNNKVFTANITGLKPETTYSYQVIAVNENDIEGKSNNYMKFTTLEGVAEPEKEVDTFVNNNVLILGVNEYEGYHNGQKVKIENSNHTPVPPKIIGNRTLIPLRFIAESLGAKEGLYGYVDWNNSTQTITICYRNTTAIYKIGSKQFTVKGTIYEDVYNNKIIYSEEGMTFTDSAAPKIENGNTYIPLRLMCEKVFGMKVEYIENGSVIVIFPRENYTFEQKSYYSGLIEKVRHTHKYSSNGNGKHSCSICGKTQTCSGNPCSVCKYSKPVEIPSTPNYTPKHYEVETLINQMTYPFDDYSDPIEKNIFGKSVTEAAWISFLNMTFEEKINNALGVFNNKFSEEQWKLILAEVLKQATQHQKNQSVLDKVSSGSSFVSDTLDTGADLLDFEEKTMKQIDNLSKKIDTSVVYKRNSSLTKKWEGIFKKYGKYLKYGSYATQLFSDVMEDYVENAQYLIAMQEMVDSYIKAYSPDDANAMRNAMDYIVLSYHSKMSSTLTSLAEIGLDVFNEKVAENADKFFEFLGGQSASKILYTVKAIDIASQVIIDVSGNREKFSAITKSEFMFPLSGHFQLEFYRIGKERQKDGFDSNDNQYLRTIFELCRATQYLNYEYLGNQYTDADNQKWINDAKNSILGRSIVSYYK